MSTTETGTETTELQKGHVGQSIPRKEDKRLVQGQGIFFDDVRRHGMGYVHFVRSPHAHAKIVSIDVAGALALDGVYGTLTGDEVAIQTDPSSRCRPCRARTSRTTRSPSARCASWASRSRPSAPRRASWRATPPSSSRSSTSRSTSRRRAEAVQDETVLHEDAGTNTVWSGVFDWGDWEGAKAEADRIVTIKELHFHRFSSTPLECSGALVEYEKASQQWTLHCNHQMPGVGAIWMAPALRTGIDKLRFVTRDIGGGFGNKICLHPYYVTLCLLARS